MTSKRLVLAYSGGLDTSVAVRWIQEEWGYEVVALAVDVGQQPHADAAYWNAIKQRALGAGAIEARVVDVREEYASRYVANAIKANALYEGKYPLVSSLSRPVIARQIFKAVESIKMDDRDGANVLWFGEPEIDGEAAATVLAGRDGAPIRHAAAFSAKVKADLPVAPGVDFCGPGYGDPLAFIVIGPQHAIAPTHRAIACVGKFRHAVKTPVNRAAMTFAVHHPVSFAKAASTSARFGIGPTAPKPRVESAAAAQA